MERGPSNVIGQVDRRSEVDQGTLGRRREVGLSAKTLCVGWGSVKTLCVG